jgi:exonuclease VII large subunit
VLGRGYAVCWNADRTAIIRDEAAVSPGDKVHVKLERGELDCTVTNDGSTEARSKSI